MILYYNHWEANLLRATGRRLNTQLSVEKLCGLLMLSEICSLVTLDSYNTVLTNLLIGTLKGDYCSVGYLWVSAGHPLVVHWGS